MTEAAFWTKAQSLVLFKTHFFSVFKDFYERIIQNEHEPEMRRAPLDKLILDSKLLDMGPPVAILSLAMDPPDFGNIKT